MNNKKSLLWYVVGVIVVMVVVLCIRWLIGGEPSVQTIEIFCAGFLLGMLGMYIAVHLYRWK